MYARKADVQFCGCKERMVPDALQRAGSVNEEKFKKLFFSLHLLI